MNAHSCVPKNFIYGPWNVNFIRFSRLKVFQPFKNVKTILNLCTRYKKVVCSKRWVAATLHSLINGKGLPTPPPPWAFLSFHWQWLATSSRHEECQLRWECYFSYCRTSSRTKDKVSLRFLALWVTNFLQGAECSVARTVNKHHALWHSQNEEGGSSKRETLNTLWESN